MAPGFNFQILPSLNLNDPNFDIGPIFREADADGDGRISINDAVHFFKPSNVNSVMLKQIWDRAENGTSFLDRPRFLFAMKLIQLTMRGINISTVGSDSPQHSPGHLGSGTISNAAPMPSPRPFVTSAGTPPLTPVAPFQGTIPEITDAERAKYLETFARIGGNNTGFVNGDIVVPMFMKSNVPVPDLRKIWTLADFTADNRLDADEFAVAMHLITLKMRFGDSFPLPDVLPERFVSASRRTAQPIVQPPQIPSVQPPTPPTALPSAEPPKPPLMRSDSIFATMSQNSTASTNNKELGQLNEVAAEKRKTENDLTMQISRQTASIDTLKSQVEERQQYIAERDSSIAQKQLQLDELRRQEEELQRTQQEQNAKLEAATRDRKTLETQIAQLKARMEIQSREYEQCTAHLTKLDQDRQKLLELSRAGSFKSEEMDRDLVTLKGQIQAQEQEVASQKAAISQLRDSVNTNAQQREVLRQQNLQLKQQLSETRAEIAEYRKKNDDLITEIDGFETSRVEYESATKDTAAKLADLVRERNDLNERFSRLQSELIARDKLYASNSEDPNFILRLQTLARNAREQLDLFNSALTDQIGDMDTQVSALSTASGSRGGTSSQFGKTSSVTQGFDVKEDDFFKTEHTDATAVSGFEPASASIDKSTESNDNVTTNDVAFGDTDDFGKDIAIEKPTTHDDTTSQVQPAAETDIAAFDDNDNFGKVDTFASSTTTTPGFSSGTELKFSSEESANNTANNFEDDWAHSTLQPATVSSGFEPDHNWGNAYHTAVPEIQDQQDPEPHFDTEFGDSGFDANEGIDAHPAPSAVPRHGAPAVQQSDGFDDFDNFDSAQKDDWSFAATVDSSTPQAVMSEFSSDFSASFGQGFDEGEFSKGFEDPDFGFDSTAANKPANKTSTTDDWANF